MLREYLNQIGETQSDFARRAGIGQAYLSQIIGKKRQPSLAVAVRIERLTNGEVPANSWIEADHSEQDRGAA